VFSVANARASNEFDRHPALQICFIGSYPVLSQMQRLPAFALKRQPISTDRLHKAGTID